MQKNVSKSVDGTITLKITVPWKAAEEAREKIISHLVKQVEVPGFRKGMAPKRVAEKHIKREVIQEEVLKEVLGKAYNDAVSTEKLTPIITPRIHVETFDEGTDLTFIAELCEAPEVTLGNYKNAVGKITSASKIVVPGQEQKKPNVDEVLDAVAAEAKLKIPKVLYEQEANRLLSQMLDEIKSLGLSLEQYLSSRGKTAEQLRAEYEEKAKKDLGLEFILRKIADTEKVTVEKSDMDDAVKDIKDEKQKQQLLQNPYLLASIIRQQKTLDFLLKL